MRVEGEVRKLPRILLLAVQRSPIGRYFIKGGNPVLFRSIQAHNSNVQRHILHNVAVVDCRRPPTSGVIQGQIHILVARQADGQQVLGNHHHAIVAMRFAIEVRHGGLHNQVIRAPSHGIAVGEMSVPLRNDLKTLLFSKEIRPHIQHHRSIPDGHPVERRDLATDGERVAGGHLLRIRFQTDLEGGQFVLGHLYGFYSSCIGIGEVPPLVFLFFVRYWEHFQSVFTYYLRQLELTGNTPILRSVETQRIRCSGFVSKQDGHHWHIFQRPTLF